MVPAIYWSNYSSFSCFWREEWTLTRRGGVDRAHSIKPSSPLDKLASQCEKTLFQVQNAEFESSKTFLQSPAKESHKGIERQIGILVIERRDEIRFELESSEESVVVRLALAWWLLSLEKKAWLKKPELLIKGGKRSH